MRKKMLFLVIGITVGMIFTCISVFAEDGIKSKGNFVFDSNEMAIYTSDIGYLKSEMNDLFSELP